MAAFVLSLFFLFPIVLIALATKELGVVVGGVVVFLYLILRFDVGMKRQWVRHLRAQELPEQDDRVLSIARMLESYAPDQYRHRIRLKIYGFPDASAELHLWMDSKKSWSLFASEGFFERSGESDWVHFFHTWATLNPSQLRRLNRLSALRVLFGRWKGPINTVRHWWISFWLYPIERILKISNI